MLRETRIAFLGAGNMGEALIRGLLQARSLPAAQITAAEPRDEQRAHLTRTHGVQTTTDNRKAVQGSRLVILAVKPQVMEVVLTEIREAVTPAHLLLSIAAGIRTTFIEEHFAAPVRVIRIMPNTPALILTGMSAIAPGRHATAQDIALAEEVFRAVGRVVTVDEKHLDAATGLSGSGPAYVFAIIEALADGGVKMGLARDVASELAAQTVLGAARLVLETRRHPGELKDMVTSPGGTTIAGLHALEQGDLRATLINAVEAATRRSEELGKGLP
ncbi:MAG: pyrroline-5-carboxylate reductase [Candidatus Methylomirabilales bacterium]